jgi:hypothetical protein
MTKPEAREGADVLELRAKVERLSAALNTALEALQDIRTRVKKIEGHIENAKLAEGEVRYIDLIARGGILPKSRDGKMGKIILNHHGKICRRYFDRGIALSDGKDMCEFADQLPEGKWLAADIFLREIED